jgi:nitroimidazol reductase NimA-like FMN-containing flavoprotein (pyridoxamine 5'-phosphate oxidase superfamily)
MTDLGSFEELDESECWRLLGSQPVGRVAVVVGHYPVVFPVNHTVDGRNILFRTGVGTKLWAIDRSNVTFEVDHIDPDHHTGWSVMVRGAAREVDLGHELGPAVDPRRAAQAVRKDPWAPGERDHLLRIVPDGISGRRICPPE